MSNHPNHQKRTQHSSRPLERGGPPASDSVIRVVAEARTGRTAIEQVAEVQPDIVVLDISMPDTDGLEACQRIRGQYPDTQVLILTMHESEEYFLQALRVGAAGYLVKKAAPAELCTAVRTIKQGGAFLMEKLGLHDITHLVRFALRYGLIQPDG